MKDPDIIEDSQTKTAYRKLRFFGKGGFSECYEVQDVVTKHIYAGKIIPKSAVPKKKIANEASVLRSLNYKHVVGFHNYFEDSSNAYIILELCQKRSMMELHLRRKIITEPETRFYMNQILLGTQYIHSKGFIHRDLKPGNLFLNDELNVKIGDFGLAVKIKHEEKKLFVCGTPNYVAPEVLSNKGYSYEVDIWSIGCIMYMLLVGNAPFQTKNLKDTYYKIAQCDYKIPSSVCKPAASMIIALLQPNPTHRPSIENLFQNEFFSSGIFPAALPLSSLTTAPKIEQLQDIRHTQLPRGVNTEVQSVRPRSYRSYLVALRDQLTSLLKNQLTHHRESSTYLFIDSEARPPIWINKVYDYSDFYGFSYQLRDGTIGLLFNDSTKIIVLPNGLDMRYINSHREVEYMTIRNYPAKLHKKMKVLTFCRKCMNAYFIETRANSMGDDVSDYLIYLREWTRARSAVLMYLTNGIMQLNFNDNTKIILCPSMEAVTYVDAHRNLRTFRFSTIRQHGCQKKLDGKLRYALDKLNNKLS